MISWMLILAFGLRLISLNQSLWLDEAILANAVSRLSLTELFSNYLPTDFNPPLIYLTDWFWGRLFGFSEVALRMPSVIFGLATIYLTYLISGKLLKKFTWLPPLLLATSGLHIYYSQEARMYSLAALLVTGSMWSLMEYLKTGKKRWTYVLFTIGALYSHYLTWLILPAQMAVVYLLKPKKMVAWLQLTIISLLALIPWMPIFWQQLSAGSSAASSAWGQLVGNLSLKQLGLIPVKFLIGRIGLANKLVYGLVLAPILLIAGWLGVTAAGKLKLKKSREQVLVWLWLLVPLFSAVVLSFKLPLLIYFRFLYLLPAVYLILAIGLNAVPKKWQLKLAIFLVGFNLITGLIYLFNPQFHRENWRGLSLVLTVVNQKQAPVFMPAPVQAPLQYYFAGPIVSYEQEDLLNEHDDVWLVPYAESIFDPQNSFRQQLTGAGFLPVFIQNFVGDITLIKYKRL